MVGRSERFLEPGRTVSSDRHQPIRKALPLLAPHALQTLSNRCRHCGRHGLAGTLGKFSHKLMRFFAFDVQTHAVYLSTARIYPSTSVVKGAPKLVGRPTISRRAPRIR